MSARPLLLPIVPEAGIVTGVATWVNALVSDAVEFDVCPVAMNVDQTCHVHTEVRLDPAVSHRAAAIQARIAEEISRLPADTPIFLAPSWGEVAYLAAAQIVASHPQARLLAVCHTDDESYYTVIEHFAGLISVMLGVSVRVVAQLKRRFPGKPVMRLHHPIAVCSAVRPVRSDDSLRLLYAGRVIERQKRVSRLLELATCLRAIGIRFTLDVIGDGSARKSLADAFLAAGFDERQVRLPGAVASEKMPQIYAEHDILLMTSDFEGSPLGLLEAMASGLVPVAMAVSGVDEAIVDGRTGRIVPVGDVVGMAVCIAELACNPDRRTAMGLEAQRFVAEQHRPDRCMSELLDAMHLASADVSPMECPVDPFASPTASLVVRLRAIEARRVLVYGAGMFGRYLMDVLLDQGFELAGLVDNDSNKHGWIYRGLRVESVSSLAAQDDVDALLIGSLSSISEMQAFAKELLRGATPVMAPCEAVCVYPSGV